MPAEAPQSGLMVSEGVAWSQWLSENFIYTWGWPSKAGPWLYGIVNIAPVSAAQSARERDLYLVI